MIYFGFGFWKVEQNDQIFEAFRPNLEHSWSKENFKVLFGFSGF